MADPDERGPKPLDEIKIPTELPILPTFDAVLYPFIVFPFAIADAKGTKLIDEAVSGDKIIGLFLQKGAVPEAADPQNSHTIGTAAAIARMLRLPDGTVQVLLQGLSRVELQQVTQTEPYWRATVKVIKEPQEKS